MTYFTDLTEYSYSRHFFAAGTKNVGWLDLKHHFEKSQPSEETLDLLWNSCTISVAQSRGFHECELCNPERMVYAERKGRELLLGTAEIRIFSPSGDIYAAPTLIFHYVEAHSYKLPDEFLHALHSGPQPPDNEYFKKLIEINLEWDMTTQGKYGRKA